MHQNVGSQAICILLVDDNPDDTQLTIEAFKETGITPDFMIAKDGVEALSILRQPNKKQPDIIILDLNMPRKDGRETLAELKSEPTLKHIPVIVLTTSISENDINTAYHLHANSYITKPIDFDEFINVVQNLNTFWLKTAKLPNVK